MVIIKTTLDLIVWGSKPTGGIMYYDFRESIAILYVVFLSIFWVIMYGLARFHCYLHVCRCNKERLEDNGFEIVRKGWGYWVLYRHTDYGDKLIEAICQSKKQCLSKAEYWMGMNK